VLGQGSKDAVDPTRVKAQHAESILEAGDVVTTQEGRREIEQAITEVPTRFDESGPRDGVNVTRGGEASRSLKPCNCKAERLTFALAEARSCEVVGDGRHAGA
jgi:hypothetical protein